MITFNPSFNILVSVMRVNGSVMLIVLGMEKLLILGVDGINGPLGKMTTAYHSVLSHRANEGH